MNTKAFTLIELMVVIWLISILLIWATSINFNKTKDIQELDWFKNNIISKFETIRNNTMMWKWIWINLITPKTWRITFSNWTNIMKTEYLSWTNWQIDLNNTVNKDINWFNGVKNIRCLKIDWNLISGLNNIWSWIILIEWDKLTLTWWCNNNLSKKLQMNFYYKWEISTWTINTVNWLFEQ